MRKLIDGKDKGERLEGSKYDDIINGNGGNDKINGHKGADTIDGGSGKDRIAGGEGHDILTGGLGSDTFIFHSYATAHSDKITDFNYRNDALEFDVAVFKKVGLGQLDRDEFVLADHALDKEDRFIYDKDSGKLYFDDDGTGAHAKHLVATLEHQEKLAYTDIFIA